MKLIFRHLMRNCKLAPEWELRFCFGTDFPDLVQCVHIYIDSRIGIYLRFDIYEVLIFCIKKIHQFAASYYNMSFITEELKNLLSMEGKTLEKVVYYYWQNRAKQGEEFEYIDTIGFFLSENQSLFVRYDESCEGICIPQFDLELENKKLMAEFAGALFIKDRDRSSSVLWRDLVGRQIDQVLIEENSNKQLMLEIGGQDILIEAGLEGLDIGIFEEE